MSLTRDYNVHDKRRTQEWYLRNASWVEKRWLISTVETEKWANNFNSIEGSSWQSWSWQCSFKLASLCCWLLDASYSYSLPEHFSNRKLFFALDGSWKTKHLSLTAQKASWQNPMLVVAWPRLIDCWVVLNQKNEPKNLNELHIAFTFAPPSTNQICRECTV